MKNFYIQQFYVLMFRDILLYMLFKTIVWGIEIYIIILSPRDNIEIAVSNSSSRVSLTECIELDT